MDETPQPPTTPEFGAVDPGGPPHHYPEVGGLHVTKLAVGPFDNNVYVLTSAGEAIIIDGAAEPNRILSEAQGCRVVAILQTHSHLDHIQALPALVESLRCPVLAHPGDAAALPVPSVPLLNGETVAMGDVVIRALHTPGHTLGSLSFGVGGFLFSGDTLFPGGPGNTFGDRTLFATIVASLEKHLFTLPDNTRVCPGHGLDTTIGRERPYLEVWKRRGW